MYTQNKAKNYLNGERVATISEEVSNLTMTIFVG